MRAFPTAQGTLLCSVVTFPFLNGKEIQTYVYVWQIHLALQQKLT